MEIEAALEQALIDVDSAERSIESLLDAWRITPAPELARLIDTIARRLPRAAAPRQKRSWEVLFRGAGAARITPMVEALAIDWGAAVLAQLCELPPDPRVMLALATHLDRVPEAARSRVIDHLVEVGDPTSLAMLGRTGKPTALSASAEAALARFVAARDAVLAIEHQLISAVLDQPDDDQPRLVYGDWLMDRHEPRGEFIALQFRRHRGRMSQPERKRERALFDAYGAVWRRGLDLPGFVPTYERGFVETVTLSHVNHYPDVPDWATVRRIEAPRNERKPLAALVGLRSMTSLRSLGWIHFGALLQIGNLPRVLPLERLDVHTFDQPGRGEIVDVQLPSLANVRHVVWRHQATRLAHTDLIARLHTLELLGPIWEVRSAIADVLAAAIQLDHLIVNDPGGAVGPASDWPKTPKFELHFTRGDRRLSRLEVRCASAELPRWTGELLAALPPDQLSECTFVGDASLAETCAPLLAAQVRLVR